ncbi:homologous-pairing protein 2 homolog [Diabrotica undecimpunctata]|uniref:homologous-pairing protein 2 homolog n=1 Tax=Diabrotica undecimpunctata TaxID=50387 RepID=UPI003B634690
MACNEAVLKFLEEHNRPFSAHDIQSGVKGDFGKSAVQKALDFLVKKEQVREKAYGKQKVYCIVQGTSESASNLREKLLEMDREINEINMKLKGVSEQYKTKSKLISDAKGKISLSSALHQKANIEQQTEEIKNKLNQYSGKELVCPQKKSQVLKEYEKFLKETKKRRRIGMDMLNAILENYPKTKKHLFEDIGIETDDDVGFSLERFQ